MGKLNIAHHKSYHPYRLDNIERVRRDEEEARRKEQGVEERMRIADSEARLDLLRGRVGETKKPDVKGVEEGEAAGTLSTITTNSGHINLFADFEQRAMSDAMVRSRELAAKGTKAEDEKGVRLAPSAKDLKPWYADQERLKEAEIAEERRLRDLSSKMVSDPLTSIKSQLSRSFPSSSADRPSSRPVLTPSNTTEARLQRESIERARAMELFRRRKRESLGIGNMTPSSAGGNDLDRGGYGDVYNREETEEAHRRRDRGWGRLGDRGSDRERRREREHGYRDYRW